MPNVVVPTRFCGPPSSANGGYVTGLLAEARGVPACVRLHAPPPLDRALELTPGDEVRLTDGGALIASASPAAREVVAALAPPIVPTLVEAREATARYLGFTSHPFAGCFVCGPARTEGDGLRIFPGSIADGVVAGIADPPRDLLTVRDGAPSLPLPIVCAALDCPGYFATVRDVPGVMLLGEMIVDVRAVVGPGPHVVVGWSLGSEGRKARCATALIDDVGRVLAVALATWIRPKS